ncbi:hypothetical protein [Algicola sagamiensis]|uniref:hypothetical protein n=1 Tax=Algicola sagamiensis TaxID=163869 RepID=UPI00039BA4FF|nr:hypothetical protein [Algicola sagamiensis]
MRHNIHLPENGTNHVNTDGDFVHVESAQYEFTLRADNNTYTLRQGDQINIERFKALEFHNHGPAQQIVLLVGHGEFKRQNDGQAVHVSNLPAQQAVKQFGRWDMHVLSPVEISNFPQQADVQRVQQDTPWQVVQTGSWQVSQFGEWNIAVTNFPESFTVEQSGVFKVQQSGAWQVRQSGQWQVHVTSAQKYKAHPTKTGRISIPQNTKRKELLLKANHINQSEIWVGSGIDNGIPLLPGESIVLTTTAAIEAYAVNDTDKLHIGETTL